MLETITVLLVILWLLGMVTSHTMAGLGAATRAETVAQDAVDLAAQTDSTFLMAAALEALASAHDAAGRDGDASSAAAEALALYEAKGNAAAAARVRGQWAGRTASTRR